MEIDYKQSVVNGIDHDGHDLNRLEKLLSNCGYGTESSGTWISLEWHHGQTM